MADRIFFALLALTPAAVAAQFLHAPAALVFFLSAFAIIPLAKYIGEAVEEISSHTTAAFGGFLSATFGNATELIIGLFALHEGLITVVKASLTGSIISNLLLVLGLAMFFGGRKRKAQSFNKTAALAAGSSLFIVTIALTMPALFTYTTTISAASLEHLSLLAAGVLIILYGANLLFTLGTHRHLYLEEVGDYEPRWSFARAAVILLASTFAVSWMSDILVHSIEPLVHTLGWSELFIGVVVIALVGNAAEHASAIMVALKNRMDLSIQIAIGSATQIGMLVAPVLVFASLLLGSPMDLVFNSFELVAMLLAVLVVDIIVVDGESNWYEGLQLVCAYVILACAFFLHP